MNKQERLKEKNMATDEFKLTEKLKSEIDSMSHYQMCSVWRFAKTGDPRIMGEAGDYFKKRLFEHFGGFTPEISKDLGW